MTFNVDTPNQTVSIVFNASEWETVVKIRQQSANEFRDVIANFLAGKEAGYLMEDRNLVIARLKDATKSQLQAIKVALGL